MKTYILLGMLLIAGLSFAQAPSWNWMEYLVGKYDCNLHYFSNQYGIACKDGIGDYWECKEMSGSIEDMGVILLFGEGNMCYYSGCDDVRPSSRGFRSATLSFSASAAQFKSQFLAGSRAFLAQASEKERSAFLSSMQECSAEYRSCAAYSIKDPCMPCYDEA